MKINKTLLTLVVGSAIVLTVLFALGDIISSRPGAILRIEAFVQAYGLPAGFLVTFVGSLWFVFFPYELIAAPFLKFYNPTIFAILALAAGSAAADSFNFFTGQKLGHSVVKKKIKKETFERIENFMNKYGIYTLFLFSFIGFATSYDVVSFILGGFSDLKLKWFIPLTFLCRIIYYTVVLVLATFLIGLAGLPI